MTVPDRVATSVEGAVGPARDVAHGPRLVSIAVPTYNRAGLLALSLRSLQQQTYPNLEIVVSDNASQDETAAVVAEIGDGDPRIVSVRNETNVGPTENFNRARQASRGEFLGWLGDDDRLDPDYVERCVEVLSADEGCALATGLVRYEDDDGPIYDGRVVELLQDEPVERVRAYLRVVKDNGTFYGLSPRWAASLASPLSCEMGNDMVLLAELAFLGRFRTVRTVAVHRRVGGATTSLANVARVAGFPAWHGVVPQLALAWVLASHLGWRSPVFAPLGRARRMWLGGFAGFTVLRRFLPGAVATVARRVVARLGRISRRTRH